MRRRGIRSNTTRSSSGVQRPRLTTGMVMAVRLHELSRPTNRIDLNLVDLCDDYLIGGDIELNISRKEAIWENLIKMIREERVRETQRRMVRRFRPVTVVFVVLLTALLLFCVALAAGILPWKLTISWDKNVINVHIESTSAISSDVNQPPRADVYGKDFVDTLDALNMTPTLPAWMPDGFSLVAVESRLLDAYLHYVMALYRNADAKLTVIIKEADNKVVDSNQWLEVSGEVLEALTKSEATYYLYHNKGKNGVRWYVYPFQVTISGDITQEDLKRMIETIER